MNSFISSKFTVANISQDFDTGKIKVQKKDIMMQFLLANDIGKTYRVVFIIMINYNQLLKDYGAQPSASNIDLLSLKNAILDSIHPYDKKYMILSKFSTTEAEFLFDTKKWLEDATRGIQPKTYFSRFAKEFRFKVEPPKMIMFDELRNVWSKFISRKFRSWTEEHSRYNLFFKLMVPQYLRNKMKHKINDMFSWEYDMQWNRMIVRMKSFWIAAILFGFGSLIYKAQKQEVEKKQFDSRIKKYVPTYDRKEWLKFVGRRYK
jgi:hypothetical protein